MSTPTIGDRVFAPIKSGWRTGIIGRLIRIEGPHAIIRGEWTGNDYRCPMSNITLEPENDPLALAVPSWLLDI